MKKIFLFAIIFVFIKMNALAQWEFQYFVWKTSLNTNVFSVQPDTLQNFYINTYDGEYPLYPDKNYTAVTSGLSTALLFNFDFTNDKGGIVTGVEYSLSGYSSKYHTYDDSYTLKQIFYLHSINVPFYVKLGREIFDQQNYFYLGAKYTFNVISTDKQIVNFTSVYKTRLVSKDEINRNNVVVVVGYNYLFFFVEADYMLKNFLNKDYIAQLGANNQQTVAIYSGQPDNLVFVQFGLSVPLSPWTTQKSYTLHRFLRKFFK